MISRETFNTIMNQLNFLYSKDVPPMEIHDLYFNIFSQEFENDEDFTNSALKVIKTRVFPSFPKPAEFLEACKLKNDIESEVIQESINLRSAIKKYGAYNNVCFDNPVIHKVIQNLFGSWVKLCKMDLEEFENLMKWDFPRIYKFYREQKIKEVPLFLEGIGTHSNSLSNEKEILSINYIGNKEKCLKWNQVYYNRNQLDNVNKEKYKQLGFIKEEVQQIEYNSEFKSVDDILESLEIKRIEKPVKSGIEYTQEELKNKLKDIF